MSYIIYIFFHTSMFKTQKTFSNFHRNFNKEKKLMSTALDETIENLEKEEENLNFFQFGIKC